MLLLARCCWNRKTTFFVFIVIRYLSVGAAAGDLTRLWGFGNPLRSSLPPRRLESRSRDRLRRKPRDRDTGDIRPDRDCFIQKYFFWKIRKMIRRTIEFQTRFQDTMTKHIWRSERHRRQRRFSFSRWLKIAKMIEEFDSKEELIGDDLRIDGGQDDDKNM